MITKEKIQEIKSLGEKLSRDIIEKRRTLHRTPELKMDTPKTEALIVEFLKEIGIEDIKSGVGGHGVCAIIKGKFPGKCLAIRADCDGLPIKEETGLPFASENGNMHACGHDAHTAMALGAAKIIMENRDFLRGEVKFIFQPFEEGDGGAKRMIEDGALDGVDAIIALHNHCISDDDYKAGDVLVTSEPISANIFAYEAIFRGKQAHVCLSNSAVNSVYMACEAVTEIKNAGKDDDVINAVTVISGGVRNNVIPESCNIMGSIRSFDTEKHKAVCKEVEKTIKNVAESHGGSAVFNKTIDLMSTEIDKNIYERFCKIINKAYPERGCIDLKSREMIGEDFARYADIVPALYFMLHTKPENTDYPLHHPKFDVNEKVLYKGSTVFALFALMWQN